MESRISRRKWAFAAVASPAGAALAQTAPRQRIDEAREQTSQARAALKRFKIPAKVEPATVFRA